MNSLTNIHISIKIKQVRYNKDIPVLKDNHVFYVPWLLNVHLCRGDFPRGKSCCSSVCGELGSDSLSDVSDED